MGLAPPLTRSQPIGLSVALWRESALAPWPSDPSRESGVTLIDVHDLVRSKGLEERSVIGGYPRDYHRGEATSALFEGFARRRETPYNAPTGSTNHSGTLHRRQLQKTPRLAGHGVFALWELVNHAPTVTQLRE